MPFPYPVAPLILSHHERWDGKGYPAGLKGEDIPLGARILSVVDYFDALMSERPYHKAMSFDAAIGLLRQESGKALDPRVVQTFIDMYPALAAEAEASQEPARKLTRVPTHAPTAQPAVGLVSESSQRRARTCSRTSRSPTAKSTRCTRSRRPWAAASACRTRWRSSPRS